MAPKVAGSIPAIYPMNFSYIFFLSNTLIFFLNNLKFQLIENFLFKTYFLFNYYLLNELIWQEGLLLDFLQKKFTDNWVRKFLIYSAYLFNERLVFDRVIRFYLDLIIWPLHKLFVFEFNNVSAILFINLFIFFIFIFIFYFLYMFMVMF